MNFNLLNYKMKIIILTLQDYGKVYEYILLSTPQYLLTGERQEVSVNNGDGGKEEKEALLSSRSLDSWLKSLDLPCRQWGKGFIPR